MRVSTFLAAVTLFILVATTRSSAQNVGIATTSPQALFHVWNPGQVNTPGGMVVFGNTNEAHLELDFNSIQSSFGPLGQLDLRLNPDGGDVGIHTFFPAAPLHVYSTGIAPTAGGLGIFGDHNQKHLEVDYDRIQANNGGSPTTLNVQPDGGDLEVGNGLIFAEQGVDFVGINTTNPQSELDVSGDMQADNVIATTDAFVANYLTHYGDVNTEVWFTSDRMRFYAGGVLMMDLHETTSDVIRIGESSIDIEINDNNLFVSGAGTAQVGIDTKTPDAALHIKMGNSLNSGLLLENSSTLQDWRFLVNGNADIDLFWQDNLRGRFDSVTGDYTPMSDARFKEDIRDLESGLGALRKLRPVSYHLTQDVSDARHIGFLAQEVQEVLPQAVLYDDHSDRYTLSYTEISVLAVRSIQELDDRVEQLEKLNRQLQDDNTLLRERLARLEQMVGINGKQ